MLHASVVFNGGAFTESGGVWTATKTIDVRLKDAKLVENDVTFTIELGNLFVTNGDFVLASTLTEEHEIVEMASQEMTVIGVDMLEDQNALTD